MKGRERTHDHTSASGPTPVDLVVNCYQRTYRNVLSPGFMAAREQSVRFSFTRKVVLINNVADRDHATSLAQQRQRRKLPRILGLQPYTCRRNHVRKITLRARIILFRNLQFTLTF